MYVIIVIFILTMLYFLNYTCAKTVAESYAFTITVFTVLYILLV